MFHYYLASNTLRLTSLSLQNKHIAISPVPAQLMGKLLTYCSETQSLCAEASV